LLLQVMDERDPEEGTFMLTSSSSTRPWPTDGLHYFQALEWRMPSTYRIVFVMTTLRKAFQDAELQVKPLDCVVRVEDPEYDAELRKLFEKELAEDLARGSAKLEKAISYPLQPLTAKERYVPACV